MRRMPGAEANESVLRHLTIGRRISEYISKSHNARMRYNAYHCFIKLIESNRREFFEVWNRRMSASPRKRRESEEFLNALRAQCASGSSPGKLALRLLWLLEEMERAKESGGGERAVGTTASQPQRMRVRARTEIR